MLENEESQRNYAGLRSAIVIGYIPIGFAYGVLGITGGLPTMIEAYISRNLFIPVKVGIVFYVGLTVLI